MDLLSIVLTLRPLKQPEALLPLWWGRAAHALLLNTTRAYNPALAETLHDELGLRPFTVSNLMGHFSKGKLDLNQTYLLRLTAMTSELAVILQQAASEGPLAPGKVIELDYIPFRVEAISPSFQIKDQQSKIENPQSPWSAATSYQELSAALLLAREPAARRISLQFTSPTTFKSQEKHVPVPLPELVFGSLLERWNAFAPIAFPSEAKRYAAECLALGRYRLSTRPVPMKSGGLRVGAVGEASYTSINYDRYWMSLMGVLAAFALFSGVGAGVSMGLGQCRQAAEPPSPREAAPGE